MSEKRQTNESLQTSEVLHVLFGSVCSKGERQAPRCVTLVRESENGGDVRSIGGGARDGRHEPRCVLSFTQQRYPKSVHTTSAVE